MMFPVTYKLPALTVQGWILLLMPCPYMPFNVGLSCRAIARHFIRASWEAAIPFGRAMLFVDMAGAVLAQCKACVAPNLGAFKWSCVSFEMRAVCSYWFRYSQSNWA